MKKQFLLLSFLCAATLSHAQAPNHTNTSDRLSPNNGWQNGNDGNSCWQNNSRWNNRNNGWQSDPRRGRCNGNCACGGRALYYDAMPDADFREAVQQVREQSFDADKLRMAQFIASSSYLLTRQVVGLAKLFSFSDSKKDFLIAAYPVCLDKQLYFQAVNTLTFSRDKEDVWNAIDNMRRQ